MRFDPIILRSGLHLSRGDTLEVRPDALLFKGQHFLDRRVMYGDIADLEVIEHRGIDKVFPGVPENLLVTFTLSVVPEFPNLQKRSPRVSDDYYLSECLSFNMPHRVDVLAAVEMIDSLRKSSDPMLPRWRHVLRDRSL